MHDNVFYILLTLRVFVCVAGAREHHVAGGATTGRAALRTEGVQSAHDVVDDTPMMT